MTQAPVEQVPVVAGGATADSQPRGAAEEFDHHRGRRPLLRETRRRRGVVFVVSNLLAFALINAFLYYLSSGNWIDFSLASYRRGISQRLGEMLLAPLSVFTHPWMLLIAGLLILAVVLVPVILAVLYKLWVSALFVAIVVLVGHSPLLAMFIVLGMVLAGVTPLRSNMPFLAVLIGLLPPAAYLYFFAVPAEVMLEPLQRLVLYAPLLLASVGSIIASAGVLALARLTKYRPGVIWPIVLVSLVAPIAVFYCTVGPSELEYAVIASSAPSGDAVFRPVKLEEFRRDYPATRPADLQKENVLARARADLADRQEALLLSCANFAKDHRHSPHLPAVLWVRAALKDVSVDEAGLNERMIRYRWNGPSQLSLGTWGELAEKFPDSPQGMSAQVKLGLQAVRDGRMREASERLHIAVSRLNAWLESRKSEPPEGFWEKAFPAEEDAPGADYYREMIVQANEILWLMDVNKVGEGDAHSDAAFACLMKYWPFRDLKSDELAIVAAACQGTTLWDNARFLQILCEPNEYVRASKLSELAGQSGDIAIKANYELGRLAVKLQNQPLWQARGLKDPAFYLGFVCNAPENPYKAAARELLNDAGGAKADQP